jgi:CheY-like chemotaxis protein
MGMAVVHGIMKGHNGGVRIFSRKGKGTTVECCFPSSTAETTATLEEVPAVEGGSERILYVDDDESIARMTHQQLARLGYRVSIKTLPLRALEMIEKEPRRFDLVITDLIMPKLRGDKLLMRLKAINPGIKTILCSGFNESMDTEEALQLQADGFLRKPIGRTELAQVVRRVLDGEIN